MQHYRLEPVQHCLQLYYCLQCLLHLPFSLVQDVDVTVSAGNTKCPLLSHLCQLLREDAEVFPVRQELNSMFWVFHDPEHVSYQLDIPETPTQGDIREAT